MKIGPHDGSARTASPGEVSRRAYAALLCTWLGLGAASPLGCSGGSAAPSDRGNHGDASTVGDSSGLDSSSVPGADSASAAFIESGSMATTDSASSNRTDGSGVEDAGRVGDGGNPGDVEMDASEVGDSATSTSTFNPCPPRGTPCTIMPLGDSITYGYGSTTGGGYRVELFTEALAANKSITFVGSVTSGPATVSGEPFPKGNEGHSGYSIDDSSQTKGISPLVDQAISTYKPNIILLMIGTNDMHYAIDPPNAPTRLGALMDQITTDAPDSLLVVAQIIPTTGSQNTLTLAYNAAIPGVIQPRVAQGKHIVMVDMFDALKVWSYTLYTDSEHPNDAGYALMAQTWYPAIQSVLP